MAVLLSLTACSAPERAAEADQTRGTEPDPIPQTPSTTEEAPPPAAIAFHQFIPVGKTVTVQPPGMFMDQEIVAGDEPVTIEVSGESWTVTCNSGGIVCARAGYAPVDPDGIPVQTKCFVCIDAVGSCASESAVNLPLDRHAETDIGDSDYLASGHGDLYRVCQSDGRYVLARSKQSLPPMHLRIVDAIGVGTFSVDADELERLRRAEVVSFEGRRQTPASIFVIPFETASPVELDIHASGTIDVSFAEGCIDEANSITCSPRAELIRAGDAVVFDISFGNFAGEPTGDLASNVENYMRTGDAALIDAFLESTAETTQTELQALSPYVPPRVFARILNILIYEKLVRYYEARFSLREKQATLGMWTNPFVDRPISDHCFADMREACESVEEHIRGFEGSVLERLRRDGYTIYLKTDVTLDDQGVAEPLARRRPHFSLFDGLFLELSPARPEGTALDYQAEYEQAIRDIAADAGPSMPIHLTPWAGPMRFYLSGDQCENTICPSAFSDYFAFNEQILKTALEAFTPSQFAGFGIPLFDALTFDFRNPAPAIYGARTNRAAETLANNPLLNVYLTR